MINPSQIRIEDIFNDSAHLIVPKYQREYKWGISEAGELFEDLKEYYDANNDNLFLGNLIFNVSELNNKKISIIDGQQRVTTILILLISCRELAKKINEQGISNLIQQKISYLDSATGEYKGSRLTASESIQKVFSYIANNNWDGSFPEKINGRPVKRQSNKIRPIYDFFWNEIKDYNKDKLGILLRTLYDSYVIKVSIISDIEAFKIFERTNARGIDLEASDLLKNHLFSSLGPEIEEDWIRIIEYSDGTIIKMLKYFYVSKKGKVSKSNLYKELKEYSKLISPQKLVDELEKFAYFYSTIRKANLDSMRDYCENQGLVQIVSDAEKLEDIYYSLEGLRLFKVTQIYPLVASAIECFLRCGYGDQKNASVKLIKLFKTLECFHFINNAVCERIGNEVENLYADFSKEFAESDDFESVSNRLYSFLLGNKLAKRDEFVSRFTDISYNGNAIPLISYIFDRFNNYLLYSGQRIKIYDSDERVLRKKHNIEHFYPKNPKKDSNLPNLSEDEKDNIGNLLCVHFRTNSKLGNETPREKYEKLNGPSNKEINNLAFVSSFLEEFKNDVDNWNGEVIKRRAKKLAGEAYDKIWKL